MSVAEIANTTVTIFRSSGNTENQFGETIDDNTPLWTAVPAFLAETGQQVQDPSTPLPRTIRRIACQVPASTGILNTDRIMDEATSDVYDIMSVTRPPTLNGAPVDVVLSLKRVTASSA